MADKLYDVIIIGSGPAGLSAAIYARRAELNTLIIEKGLSGGQIFQTASVENYPGGIKGESGADLSMRMDAQAKSFEPESVTANVTSVDFTGDVKKVITADKTYESKTIILATGSNPVKLGAPGEEEYAGRGVSYCATCDGPFFRGMDVYVVGGGDSAIEESLHLSKIARSVTIIHRRDALRAAKSIETKARNAGNINFLLDTVIEEIKGGDLLESIIVKNVKTGNITEIKANPEDGTMGLFVFVGMRPITEFLGDAIELDNGYIPTDEEMHTNVPGVFAAGDVRKKMLRQVVTAAADGAIAAVSAENYIEE
ncbi:MAG: thioredoxin-disulfide reductase [Clostridiales Family XIII bacterium]|jgi:thioredoxin reductase (NADPH)|nr:thioredoxin-disulfide reductase [Clostridiales Family XIII bacterium]